MTISNAFVIAGFPKCGTSALLRFLMRHPALHVMTGPGAAQSGMGRDIELPIFADGSTLPEGWGDPAKVNGHKFSAYVFNRRQMQNLLAHNPAMIVILCIRDPLKALVSWHNMHRRLATTNAPNHFTTKTAEARQFYSTCNLEEYYKEYAQDRLRYHHYIGLTLNIFAREQVVFVAQDWLARDPRSVLTRIAELLEVAPAGLPEASGAPHVGYADRAKNEPAITPDLREALEEIYAETLRVIANRGYAPNMFV